MRLFNFGRANRLSWTPLVGDNDYDKIVAYWLNGRVLGKYVSWIWYV